MESLWTAASTLPEFAPLDGDISADVCVVGGGLCGLLTAYKLNRLGYKTVVVEADKVLSGASAYTTAKITAQHGLIYSSITENYGKEAAKLYARMNTQAINDYEKLIQEKGIDCGFRRLPHNVYSLTGQDSIKREAQCAKDAGIDAEFVTATELPLPVKGAVKFPNQAQFDPLKFAAGILPELTVYEGTRAGKVDDGAVSTDRGTVRAQKIVIATHFPYIDGHGWYFARMHQNRSYVMAFENAPALNEMYIDENVTGLSLRPHEQYLIMSLGNHRTGKNDKGGFYNELKEAARHLFPGAQPAYWWSNQDCMTPDAVPYVGRYSEKLPGVYVATGFNQWGMTGSMAAAELLSTLITRGEHPAETLYSPQRFNLSAMGGGIANEVKENAAGLWNAVYPKPRDHVCSHMGGELQYNPDDGIWECTCHGSCFDKEGAVLYGPAQKPCRKMREPETQNSQFKN